MLYRLLLESVICNVLVMFVLQSIVIQTLIHTVWRSLDPGTRSQLARLWHSIRSGTPCVDSTSFVSASFSLVEADTA